MRKVKTHRGYVIATDMEGSYFIYTKDEWSFGSGFRQAEWDCDSLGEAMGWIG